MTKAQREKQYHREVVVSRAKLILIIVCLIAIPVTFWINHHDVGSIRNRITRVESPCQRYGPDSKICERAFEEAAASINHRMACFFQHRAGVFPPSCRGVHLRIAPSPGSPVKGGGASQQPSSTAHQLPSPQHGGSGHEGQSGTPKAPAPGKSGDRGTKEPDASEPRSEPSTGTSTSSAPPEEEAGSSGETPAAQNSAGVKACIEVAASACVKSGLDVPLQP
jgi:hypothetical protein